MYLFATKEKTYGFNQNERYYLGWQNPAWDEDGYFWTAKETLFEVLSNNTKEHPFMFNTKEEAYKLARKIKLKNYVVVKWA